MQRESRDTQFRERDSHFNSQRSTFQKQESLSLTRDSSILSQRESVTSSPAFKENFRHQRELINEQKDSPGFSSTRESRSASPGQNSISPHRDPSQKPRQQPKLPNQQSIQKSTLETMHNKLQSHETHQINQNQSQTINQLMESNQQPTDVYYNSPKESSYLHISNLPIVKNSIQSLESKSPVDQLEFNALLDTNDALKTEIQRLSLFELKCKTLEKEVKPFLKLFIF